MTGSTGAFMGSGFLVDQMASVKMLHKSYWRERQFKSSLKLVSLWIATIHFDFCLRFLPIFFRYNAPEKSTKALLFRDLKAIHGMTADKVLLCKLTSLTVLCVYFNLNQIPPIFSTAWLLLSTTFSPSQIFKHS